MPKIGRQRTWARRLHLEALESRVTPAGLAFTFTLDDPNHLFAPYPLLLDNLQIAGQILSTALDGQGSVDVVVRVNNNIAVATGGSLSSVFVRTEGGVDIFEHGAIAETRTGVDPNGADPDLVVNLNTESFLSDAFFETSGTSRSGGILYSNQLDFVSVALHEILHGLGISGYRGESGAGYGQFSGFKSTFDALTDFGSGDNAGILYFLGSNAQTAYDAPVPLMSAGSASTYSSSNFYHLGNPFVGMPGNEFINDVMYYSSPSGRRQYLSNVDLAILADLGYALRIASFNQAPVLYGIGNKTTSHGSSLSFNVYAQDADVPPNTLTFTLDNGAPAGASISSAGLFEWTPTESQAPADYTITIRVTDNGTPALSDFETITVSIDETLLPDTIITAQPPLLSNSRLATFSFSAADAGLTIDHFNIQLDDGLVLKVSGGAKVLPVGDGEHTVRVWAVATNGLKDDTPAMYTWTVDTKPPSIAWLATPPLFSSSTAAHFAWSSSDGTGSGVDHHIVQFDGGDPAPSALAEHDLNDLADGKHTLQVSAVDAAGNTRMALTHTWTVDTVAPGLELTSVSDPIVASNRQAVVLRGTTDKGTLLELQASDGTQTVVGHLKPRKNAWAAKLDLRTLADGPIDIQVVTRDAAGNATTVSRTVTKMVIATKAAILGEIRAVAGILTRVVTVQLQNDLGYPALASPGGVTINLASTAASGVFYDATGKRIITSLQIPEATGTARFCYVDTAKGTPNLSVQADGLAGDTKQATVSAGKPAALEFLAPPTNSTVNTVIGAVVVQVKDKHGNEVTGARIKLSLVPAAPLATTTVLLTDDHGKATFDTLKIAKAGTYRMKAQVVMNAQIVPGPAVLSDTFTIT